jgi:hypothetical protein
MTCVNQQDVMPQGCCHDASFYNVSLYTDGRYSYLFDTEIGRVTRDTHSLGIVSIIQERHPIRDHSLWTPETKYNNKLFMESKT